MIVFDLTNKITFEKAKIWIDELNEKASLDILIALVGNKVDIPEKRQIKKEVKYIMIYLYKFLINRMDNLLQNQMDYFILNVLLKPVKM